MIDTSTWKEFRIGDMFDIRPTKAYKLTNSQLLDNGDTPVMANSAYNNGIGGYSTLKPTEIGNMITFSDTVDANTIFYQSDSFIGYPHVQGLFPKGEYANKWNKYSYLFLVSVFRKSAFTKGFDYGNKFRRDIAIDLKVKLPTTFDGLPDWSYMENYMKSVFEESKTNLEIMRKTKTDKHMINVSGWAKFHLYDAYLFDIDMGTKLDKSKMTETNPEVNFVGRANKNNGITSKVDIINGIVPYESGNLTLSLGGEYLGSCFIQPEKFYTSQNVVVLKPKHTMSDNVKRFIATMIFKEGRTHYKAFVDELNRHIKTDFQIYLPTTLSGEPDWDYMDNYMKSVFEEAEATISTLTLKKE